MYFTTKISDLMDFISPAMGMGFDDLMFDFTPKSISYAGLELSHTVMIKNMLETNVEDIEPGYSRILISMPKLQDILKTLDKTQDCTVMLEGGKMTVKSGKFKRSLRLLGEDTGHIRPLPNLTHRAHVTTTLADLKRTLSRLKGISHFYTFSVDQGSCMLIAKNENAEDASDELSTDSVSDEVVESNYSAEYIESLLKTLLPEVPVQMDLSPNYPLKVSQGALEIFIAPMMMEG